MSANGIFAGLTMPVFTAFGWAGEENAIKFAITELEQFISAIHSSLSPEARAEFPHFGIDREATTAYLAGKRDTEAGVYIAFYARPLTLEMRFSVQDKAVLNRGLRAGEKNPEAWHKMITKLGEGWSLHIQQSHIDEESGESSYYQDLFKNDVGALSAEEAETVTTRSAFLNSEVKWVTPIHISYRIPSEQVAEMKSDVIAFLSQKIDDLLPIINYFTRNGSTKKTKTRKSPPKTTKSKAKKPAKTRKSKVTPAKDDSFSFVADLKPLHIRKGFINLTTQHWPFFSTSARSELRDITVLYGDQVDNDCTVWRLQPHDMARIVLSETVHRWLKNEFAEATSITVKATKLPTDEVQVNLLSAAE